jgi:hypothetical protein
MSRTNAVGVPNPHESALISGYREPRLIGTSKIFPIVEVGKERGIYKEYGPDASVIREGLEQPLGKGRKSIDVTIAQGEFACVKMGVKVPYFDEERNEAADPEVTSEKKAKLGEAAMLLFMEKTIANYVQNPASFDAGHTEALSGTARWSDFTNSDPVSDMVRWLSTTEMTVDREQDELAIAISPDVWNKIRLHPKLRVTLANGDMRPTTKEDLAARVGCKEIDILRGKYAVEIDRKDPRNTVMAHLWSNIVLVYNPIVKPSLDDPLWGVIVREKGFPQVKDTRDEDIDADMKHVTDKWGVHVRSNKRAFMASSIIA